ncbi:hypothetical protein [Brevibacillus parabrevis]|uniref:hypothetical protein n=1 Tax=Brevibacillus parabrevis TaxID=54914 RepID=UPI000A982A4F|nr:hypothetical protein [Brevibacillus parabrevis]
MFSFWMTLVLMVSAHSSDLPAAQMPQAGAWSAATAVQEFDAFLQDWRGGQELASLRHPLFDLTRVSGGAGDVQTIVFSGEAHGESGEITLMFYSLDGDRIYLPPGTVSEAAQIPYRRENTAGAPRSYGSRTGDICRGKKSCLFAQDTILTTKKSEGEEDCR